MSQLFEAIMVICFGISWPVSIVKSYTSKTAKGKSLIFLLFIQLGYIAGISSKIVAHNITYVFVFYLINIVMVSIELILYFRNRRYDAKRDAESKK